MITYRTPYTKHANKILHWLSSDTKAEYNNNLSKKYHLLKKNNWIDYPLTYKFNSHGFRCEEFTDDPSIMFLGCSNTIGTGLPVHKIWPEIVAKKVNLKCVNLGIGGGSNDIAFRLCHGWIDKINPKIVILLAPPIKSPRFELIYKGITKRYGPWDDMHRVSSFVRKWLGEDNNSYFNTIKNQMAIEHMCNQKNIRFLKFESSYGLNDFISNWRNHKLLKFVSFDSFKDYNSNSPALDSFHTDKTDLARDLAHLGIKTHQAFADYVASII